MVKLEYGVLSFGRDPDEAGWEMMLLLWWH
jgi:hypothetical protein